MPSTFLDFSYHWFSEFTLSWDVGCRDLGYGEAYINKWKKEKMEKNNYVAMILEKWSVWNGQRNLTNCEGGQHSILDGTGFARRLTAYTPLSPNLEKV